MRRFLRALALGGAVAGAVLALAGQAGAAIESPTLSSGLFHTCAVVPGGSIKCWGLNATGQLGDGTFTNRTTPVTVSGINDAVAVASAYSNTCAIVGGGAVKCWGDNPFGNFGNGTSGIKSNVPVPVTGITGAISLAVGDIHVCVARIDGTVWCWGYNAQGQLGDGTFSHRTTPVQVLGIATATSVSAGPFQTCARLADSTVKCWGSDDFGQNGDGIFFNGGPNAVTVSGLADAVSVSAGGNGNVCALRATGQAVCWGANPHGELGNGVTGIAQPAPVNVVNVPDAVQVNIGRYHSCALRGNGTVWCWGSNESGQLADGTHTNSNIPVMAQNLPAAAVRISAGYLRTCAELVTGAVYCWGQSFFGEIGNGAFGDQLAPVQVTGLTLAGAGGVFLASRVGSSASGGGYVLADELAANIESNRVRFEYAYRGAAGGTATGKQLVVRWTARGTSYVYRATTLTPGTLEFASSGLAQVARFVTSGTLSTVNTLTQVETLMGSGYRATIVATDNNPGVTGNQAGAGVDAVGISVTTGVGGNLLLAGGINGATLTSGNVGSLR